jgi:hypothetical protein
MDNRILKQLFISISFILLFGFLTSSIFISLLFGIDYKPIYLLTIFLMICLWVLMYKYHNHILLK